MPLSPSSPLLSSIASTDVFHRRSPRLIRESMERCMRSTRAPTHTHTHTHTHFPSGVSYFVSVYKTRVRKRKSVCEYMFAFCITASLLSFSLILPPFLLLAPRHMHTLPREIYLSMPSFPLPKSAGAAESYVSMCASREHFHLRTHSRTHTCTHAGRHTACPRTQPFLACVCVRGRR